MSQKSSVMQLPQFVPKALTSDNYADSEIKLGDEFRCRWLARICKHSFDMRRHTCLSFAGR